MITYKKAGVDVEAGDELVQRIKKMSPLIGGFAGLFPLPTKGFKSPQLVGCTDGVGTKLKIAFLTEKHDTVGIDLVAMNVNDLLCCGAKPLFFLDYFACGKLDVDVAEQVVKGIVNGCQQSNCVLLGGETAEMPGFYAPGEYDLAGFATGVVDKPRVIDGKSVRPGDILLGLPSSGLHSNGYSLVRKLFNDSELKRRVDEFLEPTKIYVKALTPLINRKKPVIKAMSHITGEGFIGNIPRVLPKGMQARITMRSWPVPELFHEIQSRAGIPEEEIFNTLNMGIGMVLVVAPKDVAVVEKELSPLYPIGVIEAGSKEFDLPKDVRLAVLVSGEGSNLQAILDAEASGQLGNAKVVLVLSSKPGVPALDRARKVKIPTAVVDRKAFATEDASQVALLERLLQARADVICLAGYMRKIAPSVVRHFRGKILNIHPALLPKFGGSGMYGHFVHEAVIKAGEFESGCSVHVVDDEYDHGPVLAQVKVPVLPKDTPEKLAERILTEEHKLYPKIIKEFCEKLTA